MTFPRRDCQRKWFAEQLELAKQLGYPVVLHIREAFGDCMDIFTHTVTDCAELCIAIPEALKRL